MLAYAEPMRDFRYRVASFRDLTHGIAFEIVTEIRFAHDRLLTSSLGRKVPTIPGAIQFHQSELIEI